MINRIGILAHALSSRMTPRRAQDAWIRETKPLERQFRAVAVLSVAACTTATADMDVGSVAKGLLKGDGFELTRAHDLINYPARLCESFRAMFWRDSLAPPLGSLALGLH